MLQFISNLFRAQPVELPGEAVRLLQRIGMGIYDPDEELPTEFGSIYEWCLVERLIDPFGGSYQDDHLVTLTRRGAVSLRHALALA